MKHSTLFNSPLWSYQLNLSCIEQDRNIHAFSKINGTDLSNPIHKPKITS